MRAYVIIFLSMLFKPGTRYIGIHGCIEDVCSSSAEAHSDSAERGSRTEIHPHFFKSVGKKEKESLLNYIHY